MRTIILTLVLSVTLSGRAQSPAESGSALERVQRLIYGSNRPPATATVNSSKAKAPAADWDKFLADPGAAPKPVTKSPPADPPPKVAPAAPPAVQPVVVNPTRVVPPPTEVITPPPSFTPAAPLPAPKETPRPDPLLTAVRQTANVPTRTVRGAEDFRFSPPPESASEPGTSASDTPETSSVAAATTALPAAGDSDTDNLLDDKHKLAPGDKISFQILEDRDPAKSLVVTDSGEIDIPYVGRVRALDKTCRQLGRELKTQLEQEYYYRASVVIGLDAANKIRGKIYIWGQVRNQGAIDIPTGENFTVGKAVLRAGGFADFANKKKVKLVRTKPDGTKESFELNMVDVLEKAKMEEDLTVQEDDFIIVPSRLINF